MKIGILTFHRAQNYGAFLQCFSLARELAARFPTAEVEVIDYASARMLREYRQNSVTRIFAGGVRLALRRLVKAVCTLPRQAARRRARAFAARRFAEAQALLPLSSRALISDDPAAFARFLQGSYDVIVVGSDAVFNEAQTSHPNLYLLHDIKNCLKISYAASAHGMDPADFSGEAWQYARESLGDFALLGVRDAETAAFVRRACGRTACHACDPTLFLDLSSIPVDHAALRAKLARQGVDFSRPVIGLMCSDWLAKGVRQMLGNGYQYVSVFLCNGQEDVFLADLTPFEWAHIFGLFHATFTHFFHGTLFSLKSGARTFVVEKPTAYSKAHQTKIQDFLARTNLTDCCYIKADEWLAAGARVRAALQAPPPAARFAAALAAERETGEAFFAQMKEVLP